MTFATKLQSLIGAHSGTFGPAVDWDTAKIYEVGSYVARYGILSGLEEAFVTIGSLGIPATYPLALGQDGNLVSAGPGAPFNGGIQTIDPATLTSISAAPFSGVSYGGGDFAGILVGGDPWCVAVGPGGGIGGTHKILICEGVNQVYSDGFPAGTNVATLCPAMPGTNKVYMCVGAFGSGDTQQITLNSYECNLGPIINKDTIAVIDPTDIDAGWSELYPHGFCLDETDENLILFVGGQSGATPLNYMIKVDVSTGSILWKHVILGAGATYAGGGVVTSRSSIKHSRFGYVCTAGTQIIVIVDTTDGSTVSTQTSGLDGFSSPSGYGCYNDTIGGFLGVFSFSFVGADSPEKLNSTPDVWTDGFGILYIADRFAPDTTVRRFLSQSRPVRHGQNRSGAAVVPVTDDARITQSGDIRITMEADIRVILP